MPAAAFGIPSAALILAMCVPTVSSKRVRWLLEHVARVSALTIVLGAFVLVTGRPVLAGWLTSSGFAALVLLAALLSERDPPQRRWPFGGDGPPACPGPSPAPMLVDRERKEADSAVFAVTGPP